MSGVQEIDSSAAVFAALGDRTRLALLARLSAQGPGSITRLTDGTAVTRQAVSQHLRILAHAGLVRNRKQGRERIWELDADGLDNARRFLDQVSAHWDRRLDRLKRIVEE